MEQPNNGDTTMTIQEVKKSLVRYVGRDTMRRINEKMEDVASEFQLNTDDHDQFLLNLLKTVDDQLFVQQQAKNRNKELLTRGRLLPCFRTRKDPYALNGADLSLLDNDDKKRLQDRHNDIITAVTKVAEEMNATTHAPYNFLMHSEDVYQASLNKWGTNLTRCRENTTWSLNMMRILHFMNIIGIPSDDLHSMFKEGQVYAMDHTERPPPKKPTLSPSESQELRNVNESYFLTQALEKLRDPEICNYDGPQLPGKTHRMKYVHDAIEALYLYCL